MARSDLIQRLNEHAEAARAFANKIGSTGVYRQYADDLAEAARLLEECDEESGDILDPRAAADIFFGEPFRRKLDND